MKLRDKDLSFLNLTHSKRIVVLMRHWYMNSDDKEVLDEDVCCKWPDEPEEDL